MEMTCGSVHKSAEAASIEKKSRSGTTVNGMKFQPEATAAATTSSAVNSTQCAYNML